VDPVSERRARADEMRGLGPELTPALLVGSQIFVPRNIGPRSSRRLLEDREHIRPGMAEGRAEIEEYRPSPD
jgi:hypothetical protein